MERYWSSLACVYLKRLRPNQSPSHFLLHRRWRTNTLTFDTVTLRSLSLSFSHHRSPPHDRALPFSHFIENISATSSVDLLLRLHKDTRKYIGNCVIEFSNIFFFSVHKFDFDSILLLCCTLTTFQYYKMRILRYRIATFSSLHFDFANIVNYFSFCNKFTSHYCST